MITTTTVWLCLITHVVYGTISTVITVNNTCIDQDKSCKGNPSCTSSLLCALDNIKSNTMINITSKVVRLSKIVEMGLGNLNNITITGNGATVMCNNTGGVSCNSCSNVIIKGITWCQCGHRDNIENRPTITQTPALNFTIVSNMRIHNCVFANSSGCPLYLDHVRESVTITDTYFVDNIFNATGIVLYCGGLFIMSDENCTTNISIISSGFYGTGCVMSKASGPCFFYSIIVLAEYYHEMVNFFIASTEISNNSGGLYFDSGNTKTTIVQLSNVTVYNNTDCGIVIFSSYLGFEKSLCKINLSFVSLMKNGNALSIISSGRIDEFDVIVNNSIITGNTGNDNDACISLKRLGVITIVLSSINTLVVIANSQFYSNFNGAIGINVLSLDYSCHTSASTLFTNVTIYNTTTTNDIIYAGIAGVSVIYNKIMSSSTTFTNVNFSYSRYNGIILYIENSVSNNIMHCDSPIIMVLTFIYASTFYSNSASRYVVFLNTIANANNNNIFCNCTIQLFKSTFHGNFGGESIVRIHQPTNLPDTSVMITQLDNSTFSDNEGTSLYLLITSLQLKGSILFINNAANSGAAMYFEEVHYLSSNSTDIQFINNTAVQRGGALYFNLVTDNCNVFARLFSAFFINNSATIAGTSIYFSIPRGSQIFTNNSVNCSLLYIPVKFNYSQSIQSKYSPVVTSPHAIKLYPPAISMNNSSNEYIIQQSKMLGEPIQFTASVFDYFNNITEPVIFIISCSTCGNDYVLSTYQVTVHDESVLKFKVLPVKFRDVDHNINISITMLSFLSPVYNSLTASFSVNISSCRAGYLFDKVQKQCVCYPYSDIVHCSEQYSEIKIGYWVGLGPMKNHYASSLCPSSYCDFAKRKEISPGYYELPRISDDQCNSHRTGVACGKCKPGYTLAYDSPKCISKDRCSARMICLVIVLTILYWIAIVAVVFTLMYFSFKIPLGYLYVIIYYYSIVDILLVDDLPVAISQLVDILTSFATLTPPLFGQLCLVEGLSGIDQQFIHYSHALAVSLILLIIVLAARYSGRLARFISPCIIRVICLLLLLAYTSLASTSLQLLRPLTFNGFDEVRTYSSPDIGYFTGRHLVYAIVAILCEVTIVIGLPLLLMLEPFLSRIINFVRIKPLMDEFQDCFKGKHRWFAAYYLICRQVIVLIVYVGNGSYYNMLYYLQTACVIIAMIHGWVQPYKSNLLNGLDEIILLILVLVVNVSTFSFCSSILSEISTVLLLLPLLLLSFAAIRKVITHYCVKKKRVLRLFNPVEDYGDNDENEEYNNERR